MIACVLTNYFYFRVQLHPGLFSDRLAHLVDQLLDIHRRGATDIDDKICMFFRHLRPADLPTLESALLNQARRMIIRRIAEHRPCIRQIQRLAIDAFAQQRLDFLPRGFAIALFK